MIKIKVLRYDPPVDEAPYFETYSIKEQDKMKILDALNYINHEHHAHLAYRSSCRAGQCGSCALKVNGEVVLACKAEIKDGDVLEPLDLPVIKDLVVDRSGVEGKVKEMALHLEGGCEIPECPAILDPQELADSKKLRSCIECYSCLSACPVIKETEEFSGPYFMRYLSKFALDPRDCADRAREGMGEGLYCCTSCGKCGEVCPKEINTFGGAIEKLREKACQEGVGPLPAHRSVYELIKNTGRSVEPLGEGFIKAVSAESSEKTPKVAFFTGCLVDYRLPEIGFALIEVLKEHGVDIVIPEDQVCCGSPMIRTGQTDILEDLVKRNAKALQSYDTIITVCAGCGATLKNDYPQYGVKLNVVDISEFLANRLDTSKMKPLNLRVTYHDPCHLVRGQKIKYEPREILRKIPGVEFVEMKEPDRCCGAGGGVRSGKPEIAAALAKHKVEMIRELGVDAVITICPFCENNLRLSLEEAGMNVEVMNILKLLQMAYQN
ncbi:MAG: succinate dehydrogenase/fumarate reductase iron-sulfur subunit [Euryarchaeota archaeon]|jgi:fumarate reductase (CoM/CoB) subunit B|nr:succinate dehydrogenase/fumarate reductase iron-sulfur subunit [Euryarchaeota archaeon]